MHAQLAAVKAFHEKMNVSHETDWVSSLHLQLIGERLVNISKDLEKHIDSAEYLRAHLMIEELGEYLTAPNEAEALDALTDLLYVLLGTALTWKWPLVQAFAEVHRANMTKKPQAGDPSRARVRQKGSEFKHPDMIAVLNDPQDTDPLTVVLQGYDDVLDIRQLSDAQKRDIYSLFLEMVECSPQ